MDATPARSYIPGMDFEPVFSAAADMLRAIPRSELLIAAVAAMVLGWIGAMIAKRSALGGLLRVGSSLALGLILLTVVLQLSRFDPRFDVAVPQIGLPEQVVEGGETRIPLSADGHFWVRADVNGVPSWNFTPVRILKVYFLNPSVPLGTLPSQRSQTKSVGDDGFSGLTRIKRL